MSTHKKQYPLCLKLKLYELVWLRNWGTGGWGVGAWPPALPSGYIPNTFLLVFKIVESLQFILKNFHNIIGKALISLHHPWQSPDVIIVNIEEILLKVFKAFFWTLNMFLFARRATSLLVTIFSSLCKSHLSKVVIYKLFNIHY